MRMPKGYSIEPVTTPTWQKMQTGIVVRFTVTGANEAGVDLVLIHPLPLCYVNPCYSYANVYFLA